MFKHLEAKVEEIASLQNSLEIFLDELKATGFDQEDRARVKEKLVDIKKEKAELQKTLNRKKHVYETQIKEVENQLNEREQHLNKLCAQSDVFRTFPDILNYFAEKQSRLNANLEEIRFQLISDES